MGVWWLLWDNYHTLKQWNLRLRRVSSVMYHHIDITEIDMEVKGWTIYLNFKVSTKLLLTSFCYHPFCILNGVTEMDQHTRYFFLSTFPSFCLHWTQQNSHRGIYRKCGCSMHTQSMSTSIAPLLTSFNQSKENAKRQCDSFCQKEAMPFDLPLLKQFSCNLSYLLCAFSLYRR